MLQQWLPAACKFSEALYLGSSPSFNSYVFHIFIVLFQVLQKFWNCWKSRLEEKEEQQQQALTSMAHAHYKYAEKYSYKFVQIWDWWALVLI